MRTVVHQILKQKSAERELVQQLSSIRALVVFERHTQHLLEAVELPIVLADTEIWELLATIGVKLKV